MWRGVVTHEGTEQRQGVGGRLRGQPPGEIDLVALAGADEVLAKELEIAAADNLKRVLRPQPVDDWSTTPGTDRMTAFLETKTVWHPTGSLGASGSAY